jgi:hypothetical protein
LSHERRRLHPLKPNAHSVIPDILEARREPQLFGAAFHGDSWDAWDALLATAFALPKSQTQAALSRQLCDRDPPAQQVSELWVIAARRAGKDHIAALIACYLATLRYWELAVGEIGTVLALAADRDQARIAYTRIAGMLEASPLLSPLIENLTADRITLSNRIEIVVGTSDYRSVRGRKLIALIADEICFWRSDTSVNPDAEVISACRPALATTPGSMLIAISSPYSQRGVAFETWRRYYGQPDPHILVCRGTSRFFNPTIPERVVADAIDRDPAAAASEWLGQWRSDLEGFLDAALVDRAIRSGPRELTWRATTNGGTPISYFAGGDISGGRGDRTAFCVVHRENDRVITDALRYWSSPHDPVQVAREVAAFLAQYKLTAATADRYAAGISESVYREAGVRLLEAPMTRSDYYLSVLPLLASSRLEIPDDSRLRTELLSLERSTGRSGKDSIDHAYGSNDDGCNALAIAAVTASRISAQPGTVWVARSTFFDGDRDTCGPYFNQGATWRDIEDLQPFTGGDGDD